MGVHIPFDISFNIRLNDVRVNCILILSVDDGTVDNCCVASKRVVTISFSTDDQIFNYKVDNDLF